MSLYYNEIYVCAYISISIYLNALKPLGAPNEQEMSKEYMVSKGKLLRMLLDISLLGRSLKAVTVCHLTRI